MDVNDFVTLANAPLKNRPFNQRYRIRFSANVAEAGDMEFVNVPLDVFKKAALDQLTYVMSDAWFDRYVTELIIRKEYLDDATRALLTTEPVELDPWQPLTRRCR